MTSFAPFSITSQKPGGAFVGGAILIVLAVAALLTAERFWDRSQRLADAQREAGNLAEVLMEHTRQTLEGVDQTLLGLASTLDPSRLNDPAFSQNLHNLLLRRLEATRGVLIYFILSPEGQLVSTSASGERARTDFSTAAHLKAARDMPEGALLISPPFMGRYGDTAGRRTFLMVRRLTAPDGTLLGFLEAAFSIDWLENFSRTLSFGPEGAVGLIHADGAVVSRIPESETYFMRDVSASPFMTSVRSQPAQGLVKTAPTAERGTRYAAYRQVPGTPLVAFVSGSQSDILAPWWRGVTLEAAGLGSLGVILLWAAARTRTYLRRELEAHALHVSRLERLSMTFAEIFSLRNRDELIKRAADLARDIVPSHQAVIGFKTGGGAAPSIHAVSLSERGAARPSYGGNPDGAGISRLVTDTNQAVRMTQAELEAHPAWKNSGADKDRRPPMRGWLAAPLMASDGRNFGLIELSDRVDGDYDAADEAILLQLANVVSISLEGLRLLAEANFSAAATAQASEQIAKIMTSMSDGVAVLDADWNCVFVNDQFERITGLSREEVVNHSLWSILQARPSMTDASALRRHLTRAREGKLAVEFEDAIMTPKGASRITEVRAFPTDGGVTMYMRDVTARREAEDRLRQAQKMDAVGQLTGGVAHDFNNLLTVILGNADILTERMPSGPLQRSADLIMGAARRAADLIRRLLAFARRQPLAPRPTNIGDQVREMESLLRRTLNENIDMEIVQATDLWPANIDPVQLENSLLNLVINARDAMPTGGKLTLETSNANLEEPYASQADVAPGQYVLLALTDTGSGMSPEVVAKAFDPFFTTKGPGRGTGLGLSMVFGYVKQSGGHVRIYSELGHGTTVKIYLPRSKENVVAAEVETVTQIPKGHEAVLMVEDEDMVREFVAATLEDLGYQVTSCAGASEAVAALDGGLRPQILLTDVVLAGMMNGKQLSDIIRQRLPGIAVLYMSGYTEDAIVHQGKLDPGVHLISKPFRRQQLAEKLRKVINANADQAGGGETGILRKAGSFGGPGQPAARL